MSIYMFIYKTIVTKFVCMFTQMCHANFFNKIFKKNFWLNFYEILLVFKFLCFFFFFVLKFLLFIRL